MNDVQALREAIIEALPTDTSLNGASPEKRHIYIPLGHIKALRLECNLVIGARGVGKSLWRSALDSKETRVFLGSRLPHLSDLEVRTAYSEKASMDDYPDGDTFTHLLQKVDAYDIWRAVLYRSAQALLGENRADQSWDDTTAWVQSNPEAFGRLLEHLNKHLEASARRGLILFDALDRSSHDWPTMDRIVKALLKTLLLLKRFPKLHGMAFLREDQFDGRTIADFPDASKLLSTRLELTWARHDLHGLLWQYLCNAPSHHGEQLRQIVQSQAPQALQETDGIWVLQDVIKREGELQRNLFTALAGEWMGKDRRRGVPYVWAVGHLTDGKGRTSPRSFLAAIRAAAEDSLEKYPNHPYPLHYESIKRGVQKASEIRVKEMAEDYAWIPELMKPLMGLTVPCAFEDVENRWRQQVGEKPAGFKPEQLPPEHAEDGWPGIREDLKALGLFEIMKDGRINMPDLYRVGFGLGRRGGVKPVKSTHNA